MNEETKFPATGIDSPFNACMYRDGCRAEHAQRLTLQHHAADQVWRIADLEVKCVTLKELHDAATDERDALRVKVSDLERAAVKRREISDDVEAELVDECDTLRTLKRRAESERDELRARLAEIEAQAVSAMTREDAALLCEEVSSDLIAAMLREGRSQDEAKSLTAAARLCASELRAGYVAAPEHKA